jgi:TolA-binding protein
MRNSGSSEYSKEVSSFGNAGTPNFAPNALAYRVSNNEAQIAELGGKVEAHTRQFELVMNMNLKVEESITQVEQRVTTLHGATLQGLEANERDMELLKTNVEQTTTTLTELESKVGGEQQKLSAKLVELDQQLGSQKAVISVVQKSLTKLETDVGTKAGNEAFESFRKEQATQGENISKVREDITTLETGVNTKAGELESVQKLLGDRITRLEGDFNVANGKIQTLEGQITTKAESDHVNNEFSELKRKFADAETKKSDEISCLKEQLAEMAKSISSLTDTCTKITDQLENLASMSTEDNKHLKDLLAIVVQHPESVKRLTDYLVVAGSNGSLPQLPGILSRLTDDVNLRQKVDSILVVLTALGANANTLTQDLSELVHLQRAEREASIAFNHEFDNIAGGDAELPPRKKPKLAAEQDGTN